MHVWVELQMLRHIFPCQQIARRRDELVNLLIDCVGYRERLIRLGLERLRFHHRNRVFSLLAALSENSCFFFFLSFVLFSRALFPLPRREPNFFLSFILFETAKLINSLTSASSKHQILTSGRAFYHSHEMNAIAPLTTTRVSHSRYKLCRSFD